MTEGIWSAIILGGCSVLAAIITVILTRSTRKNRRATEALHDDLRTNHGLRPGDYIEQSALAIFDLQKWARDHAQVDETIHRALLGDEQYNLLVGGKHGIERSSRAGAEEESRGRQIPGDPGWGTS